MFIEAGDSLMISSLRRSEMAPAHISLLRSDANFERTRFYKHFVPTGQ